MNENGTRKDFFLSGFGFSIKFACFELGSELPWVQDPLCYGAFAFKT